MLTSVLNTHPSVSITYEFGNLNGRSLALGNSFGRYCRLILERLWVKKGRIILPGPRNKKNKISSPLFGLRYLAAVGLKGNGRVDLGVVCETLGDLFPAARIVGDKFPHYVFELRFLARVNGLHRLIIYRDCRDVVSSTLQKSRNNWAGSRLAARLDTAEKVAQNWVSSIQVMKRFSGSVYTVRYEDIVGNPRQELGSIGRWLGISGSPFRVRKIRTTSIGKHALGLTPRELADVIRVAGPTMESLGYEI